MLMHLMHNTGEKTVIVFFFSYRGFGWALIALGKEAKSVNLMKLLMLAHPSNPKLTTSTHTTINVFTTYMTVHLKRKNGCFSATF
jgi:hypothetical protein